MSKEKYCGDGFKIYRAARCYYCNFKTVISIFDGDYYNIYRENVNKNGPLLVMSEPIQHYCTEQGTVWLTVAYICSQTISNFWILSPSRDEDSCPCIFMDIPKQGGYKIPLKEYMSRVYHAEKEIFNVLGSCYLVENTEYNYSLQDAGDVFSGNVYKTPFEELDKLNP